MINRKRAAGIIAAVCLIIFFGSRMCMFLPESAYTAQADGLDGSLAGFIKIREKPLVLLDPGHGGIDGGAESADGECEKDINLKICMKIRELLEKNGADTVMTRETDRGLYREGRSSVRTKKSEDLHARLEMSYRLKPDAFVSIHLNSFKEDKSVYGAQTFYTASADSSVSEMSRILAEKIQSLLIAYLENGNTRQAMEKNDVLIMKEARHPTVIVECGFLSNTSEARLLKTDEYQNKIAHAVADGICGYLGLDGENKKQEEKNDMKIIDSVQSAMIN